MDFILEFFFFFFFYSGLLSRELGASFIAMIPKKVRAEGIKDFCPISLL